MSHQAKPKGAVRKTKNQLEFRTPFAPAKAPIRKRSKSCLPNQINLDSLGDYVEILQPAEIPLTTIIREPVRTAASNRSNSQAPSSQRWFPSYPQQSAILGRPQLAPVSKPQASVTRIRTIKDEELIPLDQYPPNFWDNFAVEVCRNEKLAALFFQD